MESMPVPICCKLHAHNYTCIPIFLGRRGTPDPTGQLVIYYFISMKGIEHNVDVQSPIYHSVSSHAIRFHYVYLDELAIYKTIFLFI